MENLIFRSRPNEDNECDQWSLVKDPDDHEDYVVQEHIKLDKVLSGKPYMRLVKRMTVEEFLGTAQPTSVKQKVLAILDQRTTSKI
jgi:hypothetical protein